MYVVERRHSPLLGLVVTVLGDDHPQAEASRSAFTASQDRFDGTGHEKSREENVQQVTR